VKKAILMAKLLLEVAHEGGCDVTHTNVISNLQVSSPVDIVMVIVVRCWRHHVTIRRRIHHAQVVILLSLQPLGIHVSIWFIEINIMLQSQEYQICV
jgi:hypothetical protein